MSTDNLITQKNTRKVKKPSVRELIKRTSADTRRKRKARRRGKYADPFPEYVYKSFKHNIRALPEGATEEERIQHKKDAVEKALILTKGYPNLPTQRGIQIGTQRGNGKTFVGSKGRIVTRRRVKPSQRNKPGVRHA